VQFNCQRFDENLQMMSKSANPCEERHTASKALKRGSIVESRTSIKAELTNSSSKVSLLFKSVGARNERGIPNEKINLVLHPNVLSQNICSIKLHPLRLHCRYSILTNSSNKVSLRFMTVDARN